MDWAQPLIIARRELRLAEEILSQSPHGDREKRLLHDSEACERIEQAMVQLARILGSVQA